MTLSVLHTRRHIEFNNSWTPSNMEPYLRPGLKNYIEMNVMNIGASPRIIAKPYYNSSNAPE